MKSRKLKHEPYYEFKGALRARGLIYADIAKTLGISETSISHKINGTSDFSLSQAIDISLKYKIDLKIFESKVANSITDTS